jgi:hypothetical protein
MNNAKCYISPNLELAFGDSFHRVTNDVNGNPRYVTHFLAFLSDSERFCQAMQVNDKYKLAKKKANKLGFKVYRGRDFGGGFVTTSYNLENDIERIIDQREAA